MSGGTWGTAPSGDSRDAPEVLDALPAHIALLDTRGVIVAVNRAWRRFAAANLLPDPTAGVGTSYLEVCQRSAVAGALEAETMSAGIRDVLGGRLAQFEQEYPCHSGTEQRWFRVLVAPIHDGGRPGAVVMHVDVTDRKRAEAALQASAAQLRQAQEMDAIGRLAGGIAHDFNNLLTVIIGRSELLVRALPPDDPRRRHAELIERTATRASQLTQQLLAFGRKQVLQPTIVDVNAAVDELSPMLRPLLGEDVTLEISTEAKRAAVSVDRAQLEQAIVNLAINAREAMPSGGRLTIATADRTLDPLQAHDRGCAPGPYVALTMADSGIGMGPEVTARAFEPFFTTKGRVRGTGLGLSMVYGFVKQSGGDVDIESAPGRGTVVHIYLPCAEA